MKKLCVPLFLVGLLLIFLGIGWFASDALRTSRSADADGGQTPSTAANNQPPSPSSAGGGGGVAPQNALPFSAEMEQLVRGIESGRLVSIRVGDDVRQYVFRPKNITAESFRISAGARFPLDAAFEVYDGREVRADGSLAGRAKLAIVQDTLSIAYVTEQGDFLIEETADGSFVSRTLLSREEGSTWGHFRCAFSGVRAGTEDASGDSPEPPLVEAEVALAGDATEEPVVAGAQASHPYFRLGPQYDASLRDILILMISSKSQTGTNLSSKAATYFTHAAMSAMAVPAGCTPPMWW